jgi:hypothetical protein
MPLWRRAAPSASDADQEPHPPDPIAVFGIDGVVEGVIAWEERRLSDSLNAGAPLLVAMTDDAGTAAGWNELNLDAVVAVAAPPRTDRAVSRMARRRHVVELRAGPYRFSGTVHMPAGADPDRYVGSTAQRWLPLTRCTVAGPDGEWEVEVVIVNLDHAARDHSPRAGIADAGS